jgi:hypothetical protein
MLNAPLGSRPLLQQALKHAPGDQDHAFVLADDDAELHGLPLGIPSGVLGKGEEHGASPALIGPPSSVL